MVMELNEKESDFQNGIKFLEKSGVAIQPLSKDIRRDDEKCTH